MDTELEERPYAEESYATRGDMAEVYRETSGGFLEAVIQGCLDLDCWSTPAATPMRSSNEGFYKS
jgi:hypothetical protein